MSKDIGFRAKFETGKFYAGVTSEKGLMSIVIGSPVKIRCQRVL